MKKIITFVLTAVILAVAVFAARPKISRGNAVFTLYDEEGNSYPINRELQQSVTPAVLQSADNILYEKYSANIPKAILDNSHTSTGADSSYCANVTITIYYTCDNRRDDAVYRLDKVCGEYSAIDRDIKIRSADLDYFYTGQKPENGFWTRKFVEVSDVKSPFDCDTGFAEFTVPIEDYPGQMGARLILNFAAGDRAFKGEFMVCV